MIVCGDAVKWANEYEGELHHALLCDCPYHLASIVKRFGGKGAAPAQEGTDGAFRRMSKGFMGAEWDSVDEDGNGVAMKAETWAAFAKVLHPGAFLLVFAGCLNDDAISMAMREAGLIKHHSLHWAFGSGFPKSTRIDVTVDRDAGVKVEQGKAFNFKGGMNADGRAEEFVSNGSPAVRHFAKSDMARAWAGHRYGRQSLKPAVETILLFQKPYSGRPVDCITRTGAGALNIDAARIGTERTITVNRPGVDKFAHKYSGGRVPRCGDYENAPGRWPANFIVGDEEAARTLDRQSGTLTSGKPCGARNAQTGFASGITPGMPLSGFGDTGGSSRFFFNVATAIDEADPVLYCAKAGTVQRESGLDGFSQQENVDWPQGLVQGAASGALPRANNHACVKPLSLCKHLADLLSPPPEYGPRRLFVPFSGSGSEMCGAMLSQGWEEINGVEQDAGYCKIAEARVSFWSNNQGLFASLSDDAPSAAPAPAAAGNLFAEDDGEEDSNE